MTTQIVVPELGESIAEATVSRWLKKVGDSVQAGDVLLELETEKINLEVGADHSGVLTRIFHGEGDDVRVGEALGEIEAPADVQPPSQSQVKPAEKAQPAEKVQPTEKAQPAEKIQPSGPAQSDEQTPLRTDEAPAPAEQTPLRTDEAPAPAEQTPLRADEAPASAEQDEVLTERKKMSRRRRTIARNLVEAQHTAAMLTTFNEVDMDAVMKIRKRHKESFKERHGVGLGITSFFVKAVAGALKEFPELNAQIDGEDIILKHRQDIGVAMDTADGLVVPVLRGADNLTFPQIEQAIGEYVKKSMAGTLSIEDLRGGSFTITNGGVFGSLFSTPILNLPQVGILGLHRIEERPIAVGGQVLIHPMMYLALSYDHRMIDGRQAVLFLKYIKDLIEDPGSLLLEI